jgi:exonuclease III
MEKLANIFYMKGLECFHLNIRGLWNNQSSIIYLLNSNKNIDKFGESETRISKDNPCELYDIEGYGFQSSIRKNRLGTAMYISNKLNWVRRNDLKSKEIESVCFKKILSKRKSILFCVLYCPTNGSKYLSPNISNLDNDI